MALKPCRECGKEVSTEAASCPHCGAPNPTGVQSAPSQIPPPPGRPPAPKPEPNKSNRGCFIWLVVVIVLAILSSIGQKNGGSTGPSSSIPDLNASVRFTGLQFVIHNLDPFAWTDCRFRLNDAYEYHVDRIEANSEVEVGALRFTTDKGERFQPLNLAAKEFSVRCTTPRGRAYYAGTWKD